MLACNNCGAASDHTIGAISTHWCDTCFDAVMSSEVGIIGEYGVPERVVEALRAGGYRTFGSLCHASRSQLCQLRQMGHMRVNAVRSAMTQIWRGEPPTCDALIDARIKAHTGINTTRPEPIPIPYYFQRFGGIKRN